MGKLIARVHGRLHHAFTVLILVLLAGPGWAAATDHFHLVVDTTRAGSLANQFVLPCNGGGYNATVDWGDGGALTTLSGTPGNVTKTYSANGTYTIKILELSAGGFPKISFSDGGDKLKVTQISQWGTNAWVTFDQAFFGCANLTITATDAATANTGSVQNFNNSFSNCTSLTSFPLLNTASATTLQAAWANCTGLTSFPLINTANVTTFANAWQGCTALTSFPALNTSSGTIFSRTWNGCTSLTSFPLLNSSNVTSFNRAWENCSSLTSFPSISTGLGTDFQFCWSNCTGLNGSNFPALNFTSMTGTGGTGCFQGVTLSTASYSAILDQLANGAGAIPATVQTGVTFHGGNSKYTTVAARSTLTTGKTWTITDGGEVTNKVWNGGSGVDSDFGTGANWGGSAPASGDRLRFAGSTRPTPNNNQVGFLYAGITFDSGASAFTIGGNACTLAADVINNSAALQTLNFGGTGLTTSGAIHTLQTASTGSLTVSSPIDNGGFALKVNAASGTTITLSGIVSGAGGLQKITAGVLVLGGANTYTGATTVTTGTVSVTGSTAANSAVTVSAGATLSGTGTVAGTVTTANTSVISPAGASATGTLILSNTTPLSVTATTTLAIDLNGTACDLLNLSGATGTVSLSNLALSVTSTSLSGDYTIISCPGATLTGTFASVSGLPAGYAVSYTANSVVLATLNRYWVGRGGDNNWTTAANWASTSGGGDSVSVPGPTHFVFFNDGSTVFTANGTYTPGGSFNVEVLVVAGGGGGGPAGDRTGGGGGAGGVVYNASFAVGPGSVAVTVGGGGASGVKGSNSVFSTLTADGGGLGRHSGGGSGHGGSGGGALHGNAFFGNGTSGQGNNGGAGFDGGGGGNAAFAAAGGGGASAVGANGVDAKGGNGGAGATYFGNTYGGGGGGGYQFQGTHAVGTGGSGGSGGGGAGAGALDSSGAVSGTAGTPNTGGGGGGGVNGATGVGGAGGSGIVIVRSATAQGGCTVNAAVTVASLTLGSGYLGTISFGTNTITVAGSADLRTGGSLTGTSGGLAISATATLTAPASGTVPNLTITGGTTTLSSNNLTVSGNLTISGGATLTTGGKNISVAGNWANSGTFTHGSATVTLNGAAGSTQVISGSTTFNNLTAYADASGSNAARTLQFTAGTTQTVSGTTTLQGASGKVLSLRSTASPSTWSFAPAAGTRAISYVDVQDSINTVSPAIDPTNSTNSSNNTLWFSDPGTRYWVATGLTNWSSTSGWAYTSGGTSGVAAPVSTNTVFFNGNVGVGDCTVTAGATAASVTITSGYGGTITGSNALTLTGGISQAGGILTLAAANTFGAGTTLSGGTLNLNHATALGAGTNTLTISGGTLNNSSGDSITLSNNNPQSWGGSFAFTGSNALNLGTGAVTMTASPTITVNGSTLTEGGVISGSYNLTKAGAGTLVLTGANTYVGTTTLNAGTLTAGSTSALGAAAAAVALSGGTLNLATDTTVNAWNVTVSGTSTISSNRATSGVGITHTLGTLAIGAQTLSLTRGAASTSGTGGLTFGATTLSAGPSVYDIDANSALTLGALTGNFAVTKQNSGAMYLSTASLRTSGTVTLTAGTLQLGAVDALGTNGVALALNGGILNLATDATVNAHPTTIGGTTTIASNKATGSSAGITHTLGTLSMGAFTLNTTAGTNATSGSPVVAFGATTLTGHATFNPTGSATTLTTVTGTFSLILDGTNANNVISGAISTGTGTLTKSNSSTWTLNGVSTFSGQTTVSGGTLAVNTTLSGGGAVTVASAATLAGTGTLAGAVSVGEGGILAPGSGGAGTLTITKASATALALNATSVLNVDLGTERDLVACSGLSANLTLDGTVHVTAGIGFAATTTYTLITYTGTLTNNTLAVGTMPAGYAGSIDTSMNGEVKLVCTTLAYTARETSDSDGNGRLDRIRITTTGTLNDSFTGMTATVTGYTFTRFDTGSTINDNEFFIVFTEGGSADTAATPAVQITANSSLRPSAGGNLYGTDTVSVTPTDKAKPVLIASTWTDGDANGVDAGDTVTLTFSESVSTSSMVVADLGLPVSGDSLATSTIANQSTASVSVVVVGTAQLTPAGTYASGSTTAGAASGIFLAVGTRITDVASNTGHVQSGATAVDLGPTTAAVISIVWETGSDPKSWALGSGLTVGLTRNTVTAAIPPDLRIRNIGNGAVQLLVRTANSSPSVWVPAGTAGNNVYLMKCGESAAVAAAGATLPGSYPIELTTSNQSLASRLYSGTISDFDLYLALPTSITIGGGLEQTIIVTITAQVAP